MRRSATAHTSACSRVKIRETRRRPTGQIGSLPTGTLSRQEALHRVHHLLRQSALHPEACQLIDLFQIDGEELTEAGVGFETVKALEQERPLLLS